MLKKENESPRGRGLLVGTSVKLLDGLDGRTGAEETFKHHNVFGRFSWSIKTAISPPEDSR